MSVGMNRLVEIRAEMRKLTSPRDEEIDHQQADKLLCDAVLLLSDLKGLPLIGREIVDAFEGVAKWYA